MKQWFINNWGILFSGIGTFLLGFIISNINQVKRLIVFLYNNPKLIEGKWIATFEYEINGQISKYVEIIELKRKGDNYLGVIIPDSRNYERLKIVHDSKPKRVEGSFFENKLLSGIWYHPIETGRWIGTFQLTLENKNKFMGIWTGFSEQNNKIVSGNWIWNKD